MFPSKQDNTSHSGFVFLKAFLQEMKTHVILQTFGRIFSGVLWVHTWPTVHAKSLLTTKPILVVNLLIIIVKGNQSKLWTHQFGFLPNSLLLCCFRAPLPSWVQRVRILICLTMWSYLAKDSLHTCNLLSAVWRCLTLFVVI